MHVANRIYRIATYVEGSYPIYKINISNIGGHPPVPPVASGGPPGGRLAAGYCLRQASILQSTARVQLAYQASQRDLIEAKVRLTILPSE